MISILNQICVTALFLADLLLVIHFVWAVWMVGGIALAFLGFWKRRFWRWKVFRITHLIALAGTATVPLWYGNLCPLTIWEVNLRVDAGRTTGVPSESIIIHWRNFI